MSNSKSNTTSFSRAIFELGKEQDKLEVYNKELTSLYNAFKEDKEIVDYLEDRFYTIDEKRNFLKTIIEEEFLINFILVVIEDLYK